MPHPGRLPQQLLRAAQAPTSARATGNAELSRRIAEIYRCARQTYGVPRSHAELNAQGIMVRCKRVARLMRATGLRSVSRRKWIATTERDRHARLALVAPAIVEAICQRQQPAELSTQTLLNRIDLPLEWPAQCHALGIGSRAAEPDRPDPTQGCSARLKSSFRSLGEHRDPDTLSTFGSNVEIAKALHLTQDIALIGTDAANGRGRH